MGSTAPVVKYTARVRFTIKHEHVHPHYRNLITTEPDGAMGFQVILNMSMRKWIPKSTGVTWAVVSQWVTWGQ